LYGLKNLMFLKKIFYLLRIVVYRNLYSNTKYNIFIKF